MESIIQTKTRKEVYTPPRFAAMFGLHPDPIFGADPAGRIVYWNQAAETMLDLPHTPKNVQRMQKEAAQRFQPSLDSLFTQCVETGESVTQWVLPLPLDPAAKPFRMDLLPILDHGEVVGAWGQCHLHQDEAAARARGRGGDSLLIRRINSFLLNMIESTVNGIVVMDPQGKVLIFNRSMEKMTGFSAEEVVGVPGALDLFYGWETAKGNMAAMRGGKSGPPGRLVMHETTLKDRNGNKIPVHLSAAIIMENGVETGSVGVFSDLREQKRMEKELSAAHQALVEADRSAALGRLSASVAHEINNPLSGVLMFAELLKLRLKNDPEAEADLQEIIDQTHRCKRIVQNLLGISRKSSGQKEFFDLSAAFEQCLAIMLPQSRFSGIEVHRDFDRNLPPFYGDRVQIQQVFTNLLLNAADALDGRGTVTLTARYDKKTRLFTLRFADNGPGIPEKDAQRIFESFYTTKPVGYGTGLGLSISQDIISAHGGTIRLDPGAQKGCAFVITLPGTSAAREEGEIQGK
ncbi:MAG: PAS domain-containing protein [Deltaproteobacteria bacterium]|nr:PAS domain-containing protein [Deltaproteobacteria bacterium]